MLELLCNSAPSNDSRSNNIVQLENNKAIGQIRVDPVNIWVNTKRIHPVAVSFLFTSFLDQIQSL